MGYRALGQFEKLPVLDLTKDGEGTETRVTYLESKQWPSQFDTTKMVNSYIVMCDGVKSQFNGTTVLDRLMQDAQLNDELLITFVGTEPNKMRGKNPTKIFHIVVIDDDYEGDDRISEEPGAKRKTPF